MKSEPQQYFLFIFIGLCCGLDLFAFFHQLVVAPSVELFNNSGFGGRGSNLMTSDGLDKILESLRDYLCILAPSERTWLDAKKKSRFLLYTNLKQGFQTESYSPNQCSKNRD